MNNDLDELRAHLFGAMRMVKSGEMEVAQANAISNIGRTLIDSAKLELRYMEQVDQRHDTGFMKTEARRVGHSNVERLGKRSA